MQIKRVRETCVIEASWISESWETAQKLDHKASKMAYDKLFLVVQKLGKHTKVGL